jgi:hypothetical protein
MEATVIDLADRRPIGRSLLTGLDRLMRTVGGLEPLPPVPARVDDPVFASRSA